MARTGQGVLSLTVDSNATQTALDPPSSTAAASGPSQLGRLLRALRERALLTQEELAARSGVSVGTIAGLESGRTRRPRSVSLRLLADALGLTPERRAALRAAAGDAAHEPIVATPVVVPAQLPSDLAEFTGRAEYVKRLDELLPSGAGSRSASVVISAIGGTAGIGKTTLAVHWAHRVAGEFPDGQLYVNLRGFGAACEPTSMEPAEAVRGFLEALGVPPDRVPASLDGQVGLYRSVLAGRRMLILLDNARDGDQVRPLLPGSPGCLVIVTSRNQLSGLVAAEGAQPLVLDLLTVDEARQLLERRLGRERVEAEPAAADEIIAGCARLPLGLAIVAARAATHPTFPLRSLAAQLRGGAGGLDAFASGDPATDLRAVLSWSYRLLSDPAARLFRLLGLVTGPDIAAPVVASLAGLEPAQARPLLAELTRAHLLTEHAPGRYMFHDLLRAYAAELAGDHDPESDRERALGRLLDHYLHTACVADRLLNPHRPPVRPAAPSPGVTPEALDGQPRALDWFTAERRSLLAAVDLAVRMRLDTHTWQLARAVAEFLTRQGHWPDQIATERAALEAAARRADRPGQARAYRSLARAHLMMGQYEQARADFQAALDHHAELGDEPGQGVVHLGLARVAELDGRLPDALDHSRRALERFPESDPDHHSSRAAALNAVGWYAARLGDHQQALDHCRRALALAQQIGYRHVQAAVWDSLGYTHRRLGDQQEAIACYQHALRLYREEGDRYNEADVLTHLADTHDATGDSAPARDAWRAAVAILDELGHPDADRVRRRLTSGAAAEPDRGDRAEPDRGDGGG